MGLSAEKARYQHVFECYAFSNAMRYAFECYACTGACLLSASVRAHCAAPIMTNSHLQAPGLETGSSPQRDVCCIQPCQSPARGALKKDVLTRCLSLLLLWCCLSSRTRLCPPQLALATRCVLPLTRMATHCRSAHTWLVGATATIEVIGSRLQGLLIPSVTRAWNWHCHDRFHCHEMWSLKCWYRLTGRLNRAAMRGRPGRRSQRIEYCCLPAPQKGTVNAWTCVAVLSCAAWTLARPSSEPQWTGGHHQPSSCGWCENCERCSLYSLSRGVCPCGSDDWQQPHPNSSMVQYS
jgi:hypothetical protein